MMGGALPVFGIRIDTKGSASKALLPSDLALSGQILEVIYALALKEQRRWQSQYEVMTAVEVDAPSSQLKLPEPLTIKIVRYNNPFDVVALVKGITKPMIDAVLDRTLYYKQEVQRRELENAQAARSVAVANQETKLRKQDVALRRQEVALRKQEVALKKQEAIEKKIENVGKVMSLLEAAKRQDEAQGDEYVMRALAEVIADQDAIFGSGNVQVYFSPPPKQPVRRRTPSRRKRR